MHTYGKKKRSILPSFSTLRESVSSSKSKQQKTRNKAPSITPSPLLDRVDLSKSATLRPDSIEQLAELLLEDTIAENPIDAEPQLHHFHAPPAYERSLPQLPRLLFNGDDAWAFKKVPVISAAGTSNAVRFDSGEESSIQASPANNLPAEFHHPARKSFVPAIPRRSSKRRTAVLKKSIENPNVDCSEAMGHTDTESIPTQSYWGPSSSKFPLAASTTTTGIDINAKIAAKFAASEALKGDRGTKCRSVPLQTSSSMPLMSGSGELYEGPLVAAKKRRIKNNRVLVKVKTAINERLQGRSARKLHDSQRDDHLLDDSLNELPECDEDISSDPLSMWEIRINEGTNLKKPKITQLTGHGMVTRKPIADEGRSLKSRKSAEDPFSESWSGITCMATRYARSPCCTPERNLPKLNKIKSLVFETDSDDFFSSSPLAQSTPRIRLEPTWKGDGKRILKSVPAKSPSVFGPDLDLGGRSPDSDSDPRIGVSNISRAKKHPSPSKTELEDFERAMRPVNDSKKSRSQSSKVHEASAYDDDGISRHEILSMRDSNANLKEPEARSRGKPIAQVQGAREKTRSMLENPQRNRDKIVTRHGIPFCHSMMEMDELQWNESAYDIGMKRL